MSSKEYQFFLNLHQNKEPLILYNCWNVSTAKLLEKYGQPVIATSSYAIADSLGYKDGEQLPFELLLLLVKNIKNNVKIPLTVDIESGYGEHYLENIFKLLNAGIVGINIEDRVINSDKYELVSTIEQSDKIRKILDFSLKKGFELFINARTDVFLKDQNHTTETCEIALERARHYKLSGANCIFIPGLTDEKLIEYFVSQSPLPVNVMISEKNSNIEKLTKIGVKRISYGPLSYFNSENDFIKRLEIQKL